MKNKFKSHLESRKHREAMWTKIFYFAFTPFCQQLPREIYVKSNKMKNPSFTIHLCRNFPFCCCAALRQTEKWINFRNKNSIICVWKGGVNGSSLNSFHCTEFFYSFETLTNEKKSRTLSELNSETSKILLKHKGQVQCSALFASSIHIPHPNLRLFIVAKFIAE